jgi:ribonucleotide monophosphatase NagD (HAD superfamily)
VAYVGKPHAPIFTAALERLGQPDPARVLMIGDSLDHDVAGARRAGMLTLLLRSGVHRVATRNSSNGVLTLRGSVGADVPIPHWTMNHLAW